MGKTMGFFAMLHQIYASVGALFSAVTHGANALDNLGIWAEEQTGTFVDEAREDRQVKLAEMRHKRAQLVASRAQAEVTDVLAK
jgi:hypothetical protein